MTTSKAAFVLVHGGWHNHSAWARVVPLLEAQGFAALTLDLPGQDHMIATVDGALGSKTTTCTLESSHSPFLS